MDMDITNQLQPLKNFFINQKSLNYVNILLIASIIAGLALKLIISLNITLISDSVNYGLASREIFEYHNIFLNYFYFPQNDPYYFTDIYTFQLIPQILTNFSPVALKIMGFVIFCLVILIFSYLILKISKNIVNSFIFAALITNLTPGTFVYYAQIYHVATVFFAGVLLVILFNFPNLKLYQYFAALIIFFATLFSDTLILIWFLVPGLIYYIVITFILPLKASKKKNKKVKYNLKGLWFVIVSILGSFLIFIYERNFIPYLLKSGDVHLVDFSTFIDQAGMFIQRILLLYNGAIYSLISAPGKLNIIDYLAIIISVVLIVYCIFWSGKNFPFKFGIFCLFVGISSFLLFAATSVFQEARYLLFIGILIYTVIALCYKNYDKKFLIIVFSLILVNGAASILYISNLDTAPNNEQYGLIDFLESQNLQYGIGDYWDANLITYLSQNKVIIRPVWAGSTGFAPFRWDSAERWFNEDELGKTNFILVTDTKEDRPYVNAENIQPFLSAHPPAKTLKYENYSIYVFSGQ